MRFLPFTTRYFDELDTMFLQPKDFLYYIPNRQDKQIIWKKNENFYVFGTCMPQWHLSHLLPHRSLKFVNENSTLTLWYFPFRMHMESPLGLEDRKNLENQESIFQSGIFAKTGKVWEFYPKYWKIKKNYNVKLEKNTGKVGTICQPVIVTTLQIWYHTSNNKRTLKILENCEKHWKSQGNLSVWKSGGHDKMTRLTVADQTSSLSGWPRSGLD